MTGLQFPAEAVIFLITTTFRPAVRPTLHPTQCIPVSLFLGVKRRWSILWGR